MLFLTIFYEAKNVGVGWFFTLPRFSHMTVYFFDIYLPRVRSQMEAVLSASAEP